jgi:uncharacterized protein YqfA (UPF0365 family)
MFSAAMPRNNLVAIFAVVALVVVLLMTVSISRYGFVWLRALTSGAYVSFLIIILMQFRRLSASLVVDTYIRLVHAGVAASTLDLQKHALAGGDIRRVADWLVVTKNAGVPLSWGTATRLDLAQELPDLEDVPTGERDELFRRLSEAKDAGR